MLGRNTSQPLLFQMVDVEALVPASHRLVYMTLRRGILGEEAWLAWADELEAVIATLE
ncbi:MAG: hypothetical protein M3497_03260 [Gemmatimonadota bacterium]|nr:hypothetical protein [Gemmatimonadota bacterium]